MAAYGSISTAYSANASAVVTKPSGLAAGDLMVAFVTEISGTAGTPNTPSGWTLRAFLNFTTSHDLYVFAKVADSSDASATNFTFTHSTGTADITATVYRITGTFTSANNIYAIAITEGTEATDNVIQYTTGITPTVASSLLILYAYADTSGNAAAAAGYTLEHDNPTWTERYDDDPDTANEAQIATATAVRTETTPTGYFEITYTTSKDIIATATAGVLLAIADTQNGTATPSAVSLSSSIVTPISTGSATVAPSAVAITATANDATATGGTNDALWKNTNKPSPGAVTNTPKP